MKKLNLAIVFLAGSALITGCTLSKMVKLAADQDLQVNPNPLEVHGGNVPFDVSAVLPPKMLPTGKVYTINTIYQYGDKELATGSIEFKADEFPTSSSSTSRKSASFTFPYQDGMSPGTLYVEGVASDPRNGKSKTSPRMAVATGLAMTSSFAKPVNFSAYADHGYIDKEELVPTTVDFYFEQGISKLNPSFKKVDGKSNSDKSNNLTAFIAEKNVTRTVTITGTHSPEGTETINGNLAKDRASAIEAFYKKQMKKYNYKGLADSIKFIIKPVIQDWAAFKSALNNYSYLNVEQKGQVNSIINGNGSFEEKAKAISALPFYNKILDEVYPGLRTAKTEILTVKSKKTSAEIAVLAKQIADEKAGAEVLTNEELLYAATLTPSLDEKIAIYKAATKSGSWVAHNNLAAAYLEKATAKGAENKKQLVEDALTQLDIAKNKNAKASEVYANIASAYMAQGEYVKSFESASAGEGVSPSNTVSGQLKGMKGAVELMQGKYESSKASFASAAKSEAVTFDKGLASLLSKDYEVSKNTFAEVVSSEELGAEASYLIAVACARLNDASGVTSSLKNAVQKDPSLKDKALNDVEFTKYADAVAQAVK